MGEKVENNYEEKFKKLLEELRIGSSSELIKLRYGMERIREVLDLYSVKLPPSTVSGLASVLEKLEKYDIFRLREEDRRFLGETIAESLEEFANALQNRRGYFIRSLASCISEIEEEAYIRLLSQQQYQLGGVQQQTQQQGYQAQKAQTSSAQQQYQLLQAAQTPTSSQPSAQGQQYQPQQAAQPSLFLTYQEWENAKKAGKLYDLKGKRVKSRTIEGEIIDIDTTLTQYGFEPSIIIKTKEGEELSYSLSGFEKKFLYGARHNDKSYRVVILLLVVVGLLAFVSFSTLSSVSSFFT